MNVDEVRTRTLLLRVPPVTVERATPPPPLELLGDVCDCLEALADALDRMRDAMDRGADDGAVRLQVDAARLARAHLHKAQALSRTARPPQTAEGLAVMKRLRAGTDRIRGGELALQQWLARPLPGLDELLEQSDGPARLVDHLLLPGWNPDYDVPVLMGADTAPLAADLAARGNRRILVLLREDEDPTDFPPRAFVVWSVDELLATLQEFIDPFPMRLVGKHLRDWSFTVEEAEELQTSMTDLLERNLAMQTTMKNFGPLWSRQGMRNLPRVARWPSVASLRGPLQGKPIVLVAPGPSLAKNVHLLADLKGKAVIFAYSRALRSLKAAGIVPDLVVVLDPLDLRYHFDDFPVEQIEAVVLGLSVNPGMYDLPAKRVVTFSGNSTIELWIYGSLGEDMHVSTSCSVATSAVSMAHVWGCEPIVLIGQDLAFPGGRMYDAAAADGDAVIEEASDGRGFKVQGLSDHAKELERSGGAKLSGFQRLPEVPGYFGGTVQTSPNFSWVRAWIEERASHWQGSVRLINATEGGANIEGMENLPLSDVVELVAGSEVDVGAVLDQIMADTDWRARGRTLVAHIEEVQSALGRANQVARQCLKLVKGGQLSDKGLRKLARLEAEMTEALQPARIVISLFGQVEILDAMDRARDAKTLEENLKASRELYTVIREAHEQGYPALQRAAIEIRRSVV